MKILVLGASGQLGQCLKKVSQERNIADIKFFDEHEADILNPDSLKVLFTINQPIYVINCAAYTAVDKAEDDVDLCTKINSEGALNVAVLCKEYEITLVHISTDFVFRGDIPQLLQETDITEPINIYGLTKLDGEKQIVANIDKYFIIRTSWLYSECANNFVKTMLQVGDKKAELNVINDQIGTPTYAIDLANTVLSIIESKKHDYGIYHYSNEGVASWFDFAVSIFELNLMNVKVNPIPTSKYPTRAVRPKFSVMDKTKIKETFNLEIPHWRDSLKECLLRMKSN